VNALWQVTLVNAGCAAILALTVALAGRYLRRPAVLHALWILVLLQLFMPPVFEIGLLPGPAPLQQVEPATQPPSVPSSTENATKIPPYRPDAEAPPRIQPARFRTGALMTAIWVTGSLWVLGLVLVRTGRFRRLLRAAGSTDPSLERRLADLASRMGVRKPGLRLVHASVSPLIHPGFSGAELVFPAELLKRLEAGEQETILAHELAHIARRDHWVRLLELLAVSLFWWHPAVWWARSRLRLAEERCCDQLVLQTLPRGRSSYARGLLKTVEFLAETKAGVPALASGVGEIRDLKERLTMILKDRPPKSLSKLQRACLALCAMSVLLIFPTWSDGELQAAPGERARATAEREYVNQRLELEEQVLELEYALSEIRERQVELEHQWHQQMNSGELDRVRDEENQARAVSAQERAAELYERALALSREAAREESRHERERDQAVENGNDDLADELRQQAAELEQYLHESIMIRELEHGQIEAKLEELLRREREILRLQGELNQERSSRQPLAR